MSNGLIGPDGKEYWQDEHGQYTKKRDIENNKFTSANAPTAQEYGVGQLWIDEQQYWSDGGKISAIKNHKLIFVDALGANGSGTEISPLNSLPTDIQENTIIVLKSDVQTNGLVFDKPNCGIVGYKNNKLSLIGSITCNKILYVDTGAENCFAENIIFNGNSSASNTRGVQVGANNINKANNFSIINCDIINIGDGNNTIDVNGIQLNSDNAVVKDCFVDNISTDGIIIFGNNCSVTGTTIQNIAIDGRIAGDCLQLGTGFCNNYYVAGNVFDHSVNESKQCFIDGGNGITTGGVFYNNLCIMGTTLLSDAKSVNIQNINALCSNNTIIGGAYGIWASNSARLKGNTVKNSRIRGINFIGTTDAEIIGNTVVNANSRGIQIDSNISTAILTNNTVHMAAAGTHGILCYKTDFLLNGGIVENNTVINASTTAYAGFTPSASNTAI